jgi:hypothetical protein
VDFKRGRPLVARSWLNVQGLLLLPISCLISHTILSFNIITSGWLMCCL